MSFLPAATLRGRSARQRSILGNVDQLDTPDILRDRIVSTLAAATAEEYATGLDWYPTGYSIGAQVAVLASATFGVTLTPEQGCGIIAALSPACDWDRNIALAFDLAETGDCTHAYGDPILKARAIAMGGDPWTILGGRKVRSFFHNLLGHVQHVTIDRHALAILFGRSVSDAEAKCLARPGVYLRAAAAYRTLARNLGISPSQLQAITWLAWRRLKKESSILESLYENEEF